ncbi:cyclase [Lentzea tibetensis]|uniref:Cyclase n=1 Tax=Lentzea tibetensis TaxID=2591470 RepID=A0A563ET99_9PSEU|nr:SRPBCC family protein [Lentzea tibetensis]TWP50896.1 cyclase [Lentzea tibetensis]
MHATEFSAIVTGRSTDEVFDTVADFARYPDLVDAVVSVEVLPPQEDGAIPSHWEVLFRKGVLRWSEEDLLDRENGVITFTQTDGDFDVFEGGWEITAAPEGVALTFRAKFDFGVPSMASIIDPVAGRVLLENLGLIVRGLFSPDSVRITRAEHGSPAQV